MGNAAVVTVTRDQENNEDNRAEPGDRRVLVTGATGFIGRHLASALDAAGHTVLAMTRRAEDYDGAGTAVFGDTDDPESLTAAVAGCDAAYYLVHGLDEGPDFEEADARAAENFGRACAEAGVAQIIYLGGLGAAGDDLSDHLASRQEVETRLGKAGVPVTALRAALVIGAGSASFELLYQVVANLPVLLIPPKAASTQVQPIALHDVIRYLVEVLGLPEAMNRVFEVGGPDRLTYEVMLHTMAARIGKDGRGIKVPLIPPLAAKLGVKLFTDVDPQLAATLLDSLGNDVVVNDNRITRLLPGPLMGFNQMLDTALVGAST